MTPPTDRWQAREDADDAEDLNDEWKPVPGMECADCGYVDQPEYRHPTSEHTQLTPEDLGTTDVNYGELDYLPAREHDLRAFGKLLDDEDYTQYDNKKEEA